MNEHTRYLTFSPSMIDLNTKDTFLRTIFNSYVDARITTTPEGKLKFTLDTGGHSDLTFPLYYRLSFSSVYLQYLWNQLREKYPTNIDRQRSWYSFYEQQHLFCSDAQNISSRYYWCGIIPDRNKPLYRYTTYEYFYTLPTLYEDIQAGNGDLIILPVFLGTPQYDPHKFRSLIRLMIQSTNSYDPIQVEYNALKQTYADLRPWFDERFYNHFMRITDNGTTFPAGQKERTLQMFHFYYPIDNTPQRYAIDEPVYPGCGINWYLDVTTRRRTVIDKSQITNTEHKITTGGFIDPIRPLTNYQRLHDTLYRQLPPPPNNSPFPDPISLSSLPQNLYETISLDLRVDDPSNDPPYYYIEDAARIKAWN